MVSEARRGVFFGEEGMSRHYKEGTRMASGLLVMFVCASVFTTMMVIIRIKKTYFG